MGSGHILIKASSSMTNGYQIQLEDVFEGPMDLLLHLIKKNEVDIYDIPIALITRQYLDYLEWMKAMNIEFAGDFIVMAATLAQIKSRLLLPAYDSEQEDEEDPRNAISRPLIEYLQMKNAAQQLASRELLGDKIFVRSSSPQSTAFAIEEKEIQVGLFELIDAFRKILDDVSGEHRVDLHTERISVKERINEIIDILEQKGSIAFEELFTESRNRSDVIVTFLAVLEMVKLSLLRITQHVQTGVIRMFYQ
jgi:segregation and condensation protein A